MEQNPIVQLAEAIQRKQPAVLATVVDVSGASPAKVGMQIVLLDDGSAMGNVGGGNLESAKDARMALTDWQPRLTHYSLTEKGPDAVGVMCGGEVRVFIQPFLPPPQLIIAGGGHIGRPLKAMGEAAGFEVITVDLEPGCADIPALEAVGLTGDSYVVLITTDHISDEAALRHVVRSPVRYIGMIGSRAKCETIIKHLRSDGVSEGELSRVYAPIGLDLGGQSPEEIAVSILAEIIAVRRGADQAKPIPFRKIPA
ncbi:MAG: XdhC family protein [Anaerolineales bacterium]